MDNKEKSLLSSKYELMIPPKLTKKQEVFLNDYLDSLDYSKIDAKELIRELMTTQILRNPDNPKGGKHDIFCGHNRTLAYTTEKAETTMRFGSAGILQAFHVDEEV